MLGFKLTDSKRPLVSESRTKMPHEVVLDGIKHQIAFLKSPDYKVERIRYVKSEEADALVKKTVSVAPRPWFWQDGGQFMTQIRYGASHLVELESGKPTIICGKTKQDVIKVLQQVEEAIVAGKLDQQIMVASQKAKRKAAA